MQEAPPIPRRLPFDPPAFDPAKLTVVYLHGAIPLGPLPLATRRYTLTHSDLTGQLLLSVGRQYNQGQLSGEQLHPIKRCARLCLLASAAFNDPHDVLLATSMCHMCRAFMQCSFRSSCLKATFKTDCCWCFGERRGAVSGRHGKF